MADQAEEEDHKRLDAEELAGLSLSAEAFTNLICDCIRVTDVNEEGQEIQINLPQAIGTIIVQFFRIQDRPSFKIGGELWVRRETKEFRDTVGYLKAAYPWTLKQRKLHKDADAYLEGLELYERYRQSYDLIDDFGSTLTDDKLDILRTIVQTLPNRAKKHATGDLLTLYKCYNLYNSFGVATRDIIGSRPISKKDFAFDWELYGDNVETLAGHLTSQDIEEWRPSVLKIQHLKEKLYPEIVNTLFPEELPNAKVRKIHLSTDIYRERTKYIYDLYIGPNAALFQRVHCD